MNRFTRTAQMNNRINYDYGIGYEDDSQSQEDSDSYGMDQGVNYPYSYGGMSKTASTGKSNPLSGLSSYTSYGKYNKTKTGSVADKKDPYASITLSGFNDTKKDVYSIDIDTNKFKDNKKEKEKKEEIDNNKDNEEEKKTTKTKKKKKGGGLLDFLDDKFDKEEEEEKKREEEERKRKEAIQKRLNEKELLEKEEENEEENYSNEFDHNVSEKLSKHEDNIQDKKIDVSEHLNNESMNESKEGEGEKASESADKPVELPQEEVYSTDAMEEYLKKHKKKIDFSHAVNVDVDNNPIRERSNEDDEISNKESENKSVDHNEEKEEEHEEIKEKSEIEKSNIKESLNDTAEKINSQIKDEKSKEILKSPKNEEDTENYGDFDENFESLNQSSNVSNLNILSDNKRKSSLNQKSLINDKDQNIPTDSNLSDRINRLVSNNDSNVLSSSDNKYEFKDADIKYAGNNSEIKEEESHISKDVSTNSQKKPASEIVKDEIPVSPIKTLQEPKVDVNLIQSLISMEVQKQLSNTISNFHQSSAFYNTLPGYKPPIEKQNNYQINNLQYNITQSHKFFDTTDLSISRAGNFSVQRFPELKGRNLLITLKLEAALGEEQKRRSMLEFEIKKMKEINRDLQNQVQSLKGYKCSNNTN